MSNDPAPLISDLGNFPAPHLAVDLVLLSVSEGVLKAMMMERTSAPFAGQLVLPGGFVHPGETLDDTARRVLDCKVKLSGTAVEQLYTFSAPHRDPRGWVVSAAYFALVPCSGLLGAMDESEHLRLVSITPGAETAGDAVLADVQLTLEGEQVAPGFDHREIIAMAVQRLRGKLDWSLVGFGLLPQEFTLLELQQVHEAILGRPLLKPPFRKKMLERTFAGGRRLVPTGRWRQGRHRPAELYRLEPGPSG